MDTMNLWIRSKPADFAEILAGVERVQVGETSELVGSAPTSDAPSQAEAAPGFPAPSKSRLSRILLGVHWPRLGGGRAEGARAAAAYAQGGAEPRVASRPADTEPQGSSTRPPRSENEVIAEELGLARPLAKADLVKLRRDFAKRNHPDRCAPAQRPRAARRMSIANMLIDAALKQSQRAG